MKTKKILFYILMFLPLLAVIIALPFLPEQIPAHYGFDGHVTRWGNRYETLIFPILTILFGLFMLTGAKIAVKQETSGKNNEKITIVTGIVSLILFNALTGYFLYTDFNSVQNLADVQVDVTRLTFGILGFSMLVIGNIMPKTKMNSFIGLRTAWSMKNEVTWKKCQRFAGISFVISGVLILILSFITAGSNCLIASMAVILLLVSSDIYYSYKTAKKN